MRHSVAYLKIALLLTITILFLLIVFVSGYSQTTKTIGQEPAEKQWPYSKEKWGIIIGINDYEDEGIGDLKYAASDAIKIYQLLTHQRVGGFDKNHLYLLTDSQQDKLPLGIQAEPPTRNNILKKLHSIETILTPLDTVFIYFSGHGIQEGGKGYLLPIDTIPSILQKTAISLQDVLEALDKSQARAQILIMDACHSGVKRDKSVSGTMDEDFAQVLFEKAEGRAILSSADVGQVSYELDELRQSVFTYYLLEALWGDADRYEIPDSNQTIQIGNRDGRVTVFEASQYTIASVKQWSFKTGKNQIPRLAYNGAGDIILTVPGTKLPMPISPKEVTTKSSSYVRSKEMAEKRIIADDGAEMVLIPAGEFEMGSNREDSDEQSLPTMVVDEQPLHKVYLDDFYIHTDEVTNTQYKIFIEAAGHRSPAFWKDPRFNQPNQPVVGVSWHDAVAYCEWLSNKSGKRYRLPTEAEWEKAARGGLSGMKYPWDTTDLQGKANFGYVTEAAAVVGSFVPNGYGLYDIVGNVWEWCADWYDKDSYRQSPNSNPKGPESGTARVIRGGSWANDAEFLRCANRHSWDPSNPVEYIGFRCVLEM